MIAQTHEKPARAGEELCSSALERAHPDAPGFAKSWTFRLRKGLVPWITYRPRPYRREFLWRYNWVKRYSRGLAVLDVPCGMGWGTSLLKSARRRVGLDIAPEAICEARARYGHLAHFMVGTMADLPFDDESFDIVCCLEGVEHVPVEVGTRFLEEAHRVLKTDGYLMLSSPHCRTGPHSGNIYHAHEYSPPELQRLLSRFFVIETVEVREVDVMVVHYFRARKPRADVLQR